MLDVAYPSGIAGQPVAGVARSGRNIGGMISVATAQRATGATRDVRRGFESTDCAAWGPKRFFDGD